VPSSVKGERLLDELGVRAALADGDALVLRGPVYELRKQPAVRVQLAFLLDDERRIAVGYARREEDDWEVVEHEPFSMRALGYYERRLKRIGDRVDPKERELPW
jgi:hypothetical protein